MKNLVIFHMESVSNVIYQLNKDLFPNLNKWSCYFEKYTNYYSTATSTVMVMSDLFFGDMTIFDASDYLEDIYTLKSSKKSVFECLNERGYVTQTFFYGYDGHERNRKLNGVINNGGTFWDGDEEEAFLSSFDHFTQTAVPFAAFIEENVSHVTYKGTRLKKEMPQIEKYENKYRVMDETVGRIFEQLQENGLLDNTVIILYGDHGDEYWFHGYHEGYTHAIAPYTSLVHCPFFIFNGMNESKINDELLSTVDTYNMIMNALGIGKKHEAAEYVISRNLFANQQRRADIFDKGYSITDGKYTLLLTRAGLSMYQNRLDPYNLNNILEFFLFEEDELRYNEEFNKMLSSHYKSLMIQAEKDEIRNKFGYLRKKLYQYVESNEFLKGKWAWNKISRQRHNL